MFNGLRSVGSFLLSVVMRQHVNETHEIHLSLRRSWNPKHTHHLFSRFPLPYMLDVWFPLHILNFLCALPARTYLGHFWQRIHQRKGQILQVPGVWRSSCNRRCPLATCRTSPHVRLEQGRSRDQCHLHSWAPRPHLPPAHPVPCHGCLATGW